MAVREAINDVIEAGLAHAHPGAVVEALVRYRSRGGEAGDDCERRPEEDEDDEAAEIRFGQREIGAEPVIGLVVGLPHPPLHAHVDTQVDDERGKEWDQCGGHGNGHSRGEHLVVLAIAIVEEGQRSVVVLARRDELERADQQTDQPDEEQDARRIRLGEPVVLAAALLVLTYHTQAHIVLDCSRLRGGVE